MTNIWMKKVLWSDEINWNAWVYIQNEHRTLPGAYSPYAVAER